MLQNHIVRRGRYDIEDAKVMTKHFEGSLTINQRPGCQEIVLTYLEKCLEIAQFNEQVNNAVEQVKNVQK